MNDANFWQTVAAFLGGMIGMKLVGWVADWINGKGAQLINEKLEKVQAKINESSILSQINADDAVIDIIQTAIPDVISELSDTTKKDIADGKFDKVEWEHIGERLWAKVRPHIESGKHDYLEHSSFSDGKMIATMIVKRFFNKQKLAKDGVIAGK